MAAFHLIIYGRFWVITEGVEKSDPYVAVILNEDQSDHYISGMKFCMAIVRTTTIGSRESPTTSIHAPVGPPTLAVSYKSPHV
jgi:hypothetical protein